MIDVLIVYVVVDVDVDVDVDVNVSLINISQVHSQPALLFLCL